MNLKLNRGNDKSEITYMDMTICRDPSENNILRTHWWQKPQFAYRILNFHSYHPFKMKINIVTEYVKNAFKVSSFCFWNMTATKLKNVLKNSNYPNGLILKVIRNVRGELGNELENVLSKPAILRNKPAILRNRLTIMKNRKFSRNYVSAPYHPAIRENLISIINELQLNIRIAPKILRTGFTFTQTLRTTGTCRHSKSHSIHP